MDIEHAKKLLYEKCDSDSKCVSDDDKDVLEIGIEADLFKSPKSNTYAIPLSPQIQQIKKQLFITPISPLPNTPTRIVHEHSYKSNLIVTFDNRSLSRSAPFAGTNNKQTQAHNNSLISITFDNDIANTFTPETNAAFPSTHTTAARFANHSHMPNDQSSIHSLASSPLSHAHNSNTKPLINQYESSTSQTQTRMHQANYHPKHSRTLKRIIPQKPNNPNNIAHKKPTTRTINLKNQNVPNGVHLAIAVDKNKHFSKNALKKITRNLCSELN